MHFLQRTYCFTAYYSSLKVQNVENFQDFFQQKIQLFTILKLVNANLCLGFQSHILHFLT